MAAEFRTKVFKSGNSHALRLPRELGTVEGDEMVIVPHGDGRFTLWRQSDALNVLMSLYGSMSPGFMAGGRGDTEQDARTRPGDENRSAA